MLKANGTSSLIKGVSAAAVAMSFGLGLSACSESQVAGGGPSGTEAGNAITAQILTADAQPAALAKVRLTPRQELDNEGSYTAETDRNGQVEFKNVVKGNYILEAKLGDNALQMNVNVSDDKTTELGKNELSKIASISGVIDDSAEGVIKVRGLDHSAKVKKGEFVLDSLPEGHFDLVFIPAESSKDTVSTYLKLEAGAESSTSTFAAEGESLLLDDFEDGNNQHRFGPKYFGPSDGGWWFITRNDTNTVILTGVNAKGEPKLEKEDGNTLFHATFDFASLDSVNYNKDSVQIRWPWGNLGVNLGSNDKSICYDLNSVKAVAFRAKGSGAFTFKLVDEKHKSDNFNGEFAASYMGLLDDWQTYEIPLDKIIDERSGSLDCVTLLLWEMDTAKKDTVEIWLDDIKLIGGDRESIWEK